MLPIPFTKHHACKDFTEKCRQWISISCAYLYLDEGSLPSPSISKRTYMGFKQSVTEPWCFDIIAEFSSIHALPTGSLPLEESGFRAVSRRSWMFITSKAQRDAKRLNWGKKKKSVQLINWKRWEAKTPGEAVQKLAWSKEILARSCPVQWLATVRYERHIEQSRA